MAEAENTLITPDMHERKGVWGNERTSYPISDSDIRKWAIATYWPETPPRLYWDADYAKTTRWGEIVAPMDFNPFAWPPARGGGAGGAARAAAAARAAGGRRFTVMNGGQTDTYGVRMRSGDVITSRTRLKDWEEREGRLGLTLYVYQETEWRNQRNEHVRTRVSISIRY
jgi:hypothetical protein